MFSECGRAVSNVHGNVQYPSFYNSYKFALGVRAFLEMLMFLPVRKTGMLNV